MPIPEEFSTAGHFMYDNYFLSNEVEDQFNSYLDLQNFCSVDRSLEGTPGMVRKINTYKATDGTEKLAMGEGNDKSIIVDFSEEEYRILLAQNRFCYYDEQAMTDPLIVPTGLNHAATDMFNTTNHEIYQEFKKATLQVTSNTLNFDTFVDGMALLDIKENLEGMSIFAFVSPLDMASLRKVLKDDLKYVSEFVKSGYVGTVAGVNLYTKKDATQGTVVMGTKEAVTLFTKKGTEVKQVRENENTRYNAVYTRKYYLPALTDATKVVKLQTTAAANSEVEDD